MWLYVQGFSIYLWNRLCFFFNHLLSSINRHSMSGATSLDTKGKRKSLSPKDCVVATPEEFVKRFGGCQVINKVKPQLVDSMIAVLAISTGPQNPKPVKLCSDQ